jgi:uncharacterized protein DUF3592
VTEAHPLKATLAGVLLFAVGLALAGGLFYLDRQERDRLASWDHAEGKVTDNLAPSSGDRVLQRIAFTTTTGTRISFTVAASRRRAYAIGDAVPVLYPADQPESAVVDNVLRRRVRNSFGGGAALILVMLGGYVAWYASRSDRSDPGSRNLAS